MKFNLKHVFGWVTVLCVFLGLVMFLLQHVGIFFLYVPPPQQKGPYQEESGFMCQITYDDVNIFECSNDSLFIEGIYGGDGGGLGGV